MAGSIIVGLDIGSSSIKSLVVSKKAEEEGFEVLSQISEPVFGVRRGVVLDVEKVSETISSVLEKTQKESGQKIKSLFVNINGGHLFSTSSRGSIAVSRADQKISKEDIERVLQIAQAFSLPPNREILEIFPKEFVVDGERGIKEALGMKGVRLETEVLVLGCFSPYLNNLTKAVLESDYQIEDIIFSPLASAEAVLSEREKELGVLLLDIGAGTTGFVVFLEGSLIGAGVIPIGSGHITNDIATGLKTDVETAEKIKVLHGSCFLTGGKKIKIKEKISGEILSFSQKSLGKIVDSRVLEIFEQVQKELKKIGSPKLPAGVVLTGGGAKLPKIKEFAKKVLKMSSRIGRPSGFFPSQDDPQLSCVCGLVLKGKEQEIFPEGGLFRKIKKILRSFIP